MKRPPLNVAPDAIELPDLITRYQRARRLAHLHLSRCDRLLDTIRKTMKPGDHVDIGTRRYTLTDNYATANRVYRAHAVTRFELVPTDL